MERLLTINKTAEILSISRRSVYRLIEAGDLPSVDLMGKKRIPVSILERFIRRLMGKETLTEKEDRIKAEQLRAWAKAQGIRGY